MKKKIMAVSIVSGMLLAGFTNAIANDCPSCTGTETTSNTEVDATLQSFENFTDKLPGELTYNESAHRTALRVYGKTAAPDVSGSGNLETTRTTAKTMEQNFASAYNALHQIASVDIPTGFGAKFNTNAMSGSTAGLNTGGYEIDAKAQNGISAQGKITPTPPTACDLPQQQEKKLYDGTQITNANSYGNEYTEGTGAGNTVHAVFAGADASTKLDVKQNMENARINTLSRNAIGAELTSTIIPGGTSLKANIANAVKTQNPCPSEAQQQVATQTRLAGQTIAAMAGNGATYSGQFNFTNKVEVGQN